MKRTASQAGLLAGESETRLPNTMARSADHDQGFANIDTDAAPAGETTVVIVGAGPSGLMLAWVYARPFLQVRMC